MAKLFAMKKFFKWFGIILGSLILLIVIILFVLKFNAESRLSKTYSINISVPVIPTDSASLEAGKHWSNLCTGCHRYDFAGKVFFNDPKLGSVSSLNLTSGKGGVGKTLTDKDWVIALRHGVKPDGHPLLAMPAKDFNNMGEKELASLIAYMKSIPPVDQELPPTNLKFLGKILLSIGAFGDALSAEVIDHDKGFDPVPAAGKTVEYGHYLVNISGCRTCHGKQLTGGKDPNPAAPPAPDLTIGGHLGKWKVDDFTKTLRTGQTPERKALNMEFMPWDVFGKYNDNEISAIFAYLGSLPVKK